MSGSCLSVSQLRPRRPELREEPVLGYPPQPGHPGRAAGADLRSEYPLDGEQMGCPPPAEVVGEVHQGFGQLVQVAVFLGMSLVDRLPGFDDRVPLLVRLAPVALD